MTEKRFFKALFKTIIFFGIIHLIVLTVMALTTGDFKYLNVFEVVSISLLVPGIEKGFLSFVISTLIAALIFFLFYHKSKNKS